MTTPLAPRPRRRSLRRATATLAVLALAGGIAAGCGSDDEGSDGPDGSGASGVVAEDGALSWLPAETWLVASADLSADRIDEAVTTLDRLPAWALAEGFLPASDGAGLRKEALEQIESESKENDESDDDVTAEQLEKAFGDHVGFAITSNDPDELSGDMPPFAVWVEVDDEEAARDLVKPLADGKISEKSHEGVDYYSDEGDGAILVEGGLLLVTPEEADLKALIEVHEGDDSLADDDQARAMVDASIGEAFIGAALATDPVLDAAPGLLDEAGEAGEAAGDPADLEQVLDSPGVEHLVPDWVGTSATIDDTGLRFRATWSNPRPIAEPETGSRELVERMPADAPIVQAGVSDGSEVRRIQDAWAEVRDTYDLDLREMTSSCAPDEQWACELAAEVAVAVLEDENLAEASEESGDTAAAMTQDITPLLGLAAAAEPGAGRGGAAAATPPLDARLYEAVTTAGAYPEGYEPPQELVDAAERAGLEISTGVGGATAVASADPAERTVGGGAPALIVRVRPNSPLGRALQQELDAEARTTLRTMGIDVTALFGPKGLALQTEEVDGLFVGGFPPAAPSKIVPALEGDADTLGDADSYQRVVDAVGVPDEVGVYGYIDLGAYVEGIFGAIAAEEPEANRILPTVRNNLEDVPGILSYSAREQVGGHEVGVVETVIPILE